jgi:hypothetical protein
VRPHHVSYAAGLQSQVPDALREAAQSPFSARALLYALLLDAAPGVRQAQLAQLQAGAEPRDYQETLRLADLVRPLPDAARLPLLDRAMPALRQMSPPQHQVFRAQVEALIHADQKVSLFEYALHCMLRRYLDMDYNRQRPVVRYRVPDQVLPQMTMVLSLLAWAGRYAGLYRHGIHRRAVAARSVFTPSVRCSIADAGPGVSRSETPRAGELCSLHPRRRASHCARGGVAAGHQRHAGVSDATAGGGGRVSRGDRADYSIAKRAA